MSTQNVEKFLARYVNLKSVISISLAIILTVLMNNVEQFTRYIPIILVLFMMWIVVSIFEKGSFTTWLAGFFEKGQDNKKEVRLAGISLTEAFRHQINGVQDTFESPYQEPTKSILPEDSYQVPAE